MDPRAILKRAPTIKETTSNAQLQNNSTMILAEVREMDSKDDLPRLGLTQRQIDSDVLSDSAYTYILCDEIDDTAEDDSDIASTTNFGRVKIGDGLEINDGVLTAQTYPYADHENFGIIKPSADFNFDSNCALKLANKNEDIIYQKAAKNIVEDGIIKIEGSIYEKNWQRLLTRENVKPETYTLDKHGFFKHYRIRCRNTQIRYFRWYGFDIDDDLYELQKVMPSMSADSMSGFAITSSGLASRNLYNLTNDSISSWANFEKRLNGEFWVKYELPEPQSVDMIDLAARLGAESEIIPNGSNYFGLSEVNFGTQLREYKRELNVYERLIPAMRSNSQNGYDMFVSAN